MNVEKVYKKNIYSCIPATINVAKFILYCINNEFCNT